MPGNAHPLKAAVTQAALEAAGLDGAPPARPALEVAAAVGDPMQPLVAGLTMAALPHVPVLLAGGSQMAAVLALIVAIARERGQPPDLDRLGIATTSWVATDPTADLAGLVSTIADAPVFASGLDFSGSRCPPLRRYEQFMVKEGVGAGAAAVLAALQTDADAHQILAAVERVYEEIYGSEAVADETAPAQS
jgi:NaMN:DMB phosphoribosyltransferase